MGGINMNHSKLFQFDSQLLTDLVLLLLGLLSLAITILIIVLIVKAVRKYLNSSGSRTNRKIVKKNLATILKDARMNKGYTQEFVAETLGISRQTLYKWEKGTAEPNLSFLSELAKLYEINMETLISSCK